MEYESEADRIYFEQVAPRINSRLSAPSLEDDLMPDVPLDPTARRYEILLADRIYFGKVRPQLVAHGNTS